MTSFSHLMKARYKDFKGLMPNCNKKIITKLLQGVHRAAADDTLPPSMRYAHVAKEIEITKKDYRNINTFYERNPVGFVWCHEGESLNPTSELLCDVEALMETHFQSMKSYQEADYTENKATHAKMISYGDDDETDKLIRGVCLKKEEERLRDDHEYIIPSKDFTLRSLRRNFETFKDLKVLYNKSLPYNKTLRRNNSAIQHIDVIVPMNEKIALHDFTVCKSITCPNCGNLVTISVEAKLGSSSIRCPYYLSDGNPCRHNITLRDYKEAGYEENKIVFEYVGNILMPQGEEYVQRYAKFYSFCELKAGIQRVNCLYNNNEIYILSRDYDEEELLFSEADLEEQEVPDNLPPTRFFKLMHKLKDVVKEKYRFEILNRGELFQCNIILAALARMFYDYRDYHCLVFGDSGTAKSTPATIWGNLLFESVKISLGGSVTEANIIADMSEKQPNPGDLAKYDLTVYDEAAPAFEVNKSSDDYKKALIPNLKNFLLESRVSRDARGGFEAPRTSNVIVLANFLPSHLIELKEQFRKEYNRYRMAYAKTESKYEGPEYNFDENWPVVISDPEHFGKMMENPFIADAYDQLCRRYHDGRREMLTNAEIAFLNRFTMFYKVENMLSEQTVQAAASNIQFNKLVDEIRIEKLYYKIKNTILHIFAPGEPTTEQNEAAMKYLNQDILPRYPNIAREYEQNFADREQRLYTVAVLVIMALEGTKEVTPAVRETFERIFRHNNKTISRELYDMEDEKDEKHKEKFIRVLELALTPDNKKKFYELQDATIYRDIVNRLLRDKNIERTKQGYHLTEKGEQRLHEIKEEKAQRKEEIKKRSDTVESTKPGDYTFDEMELFSGGK